MKIMKQVEFDLHSLENIEAERLLLLEIQNQNQQKLIKSGLVERAINSAPYYPVNDLTRFAVASKELDLVNEEAIVARLRFMTPQLNQAGRIIIPHRPLDIAVDYCDGREDSRELRNDFTYADADLAFDLLDGLEADKEFGFLPHLSDDRTEILPQLERDKRAQEALSFL